jgi:hypothetical protein
VLIDIFVRIEGFFKRLESYTAVPPTAAMTDVIVKIMMEILSILAIATKEIKQGRSSEYTDLQYIICSWLTFFLEKFVKKLLGRSDIEDALKRLDTLTMEETRMAIAETLNVMHKMDDKVAKIDDKVAVLVDGGRDTFSGLHAFLNVDIARCKRSKYRHTAVCEHRRWREAFVVWSHCSWFLKLIHPHREPVTKRTSKLALSPGLLDEP